MRLEKLNCYAYCEPEPQTVAHVYYAGVQIKVAWHKASVWDKEGKGVGWGYARRVKNWHKNNAMLCQKRRLTLKKKTSNIPIWAHDASIVKFTYLWWQPVDQSWCDAPCKPENVANSWMLKQDEILKWWGPMREEQSKSTVGKRNTSIGCQGGPP